LFGVWNLGFGISNSGELFLLVADLSSTHFFVFVNGRVGEKLIKVKNLGQKICSRFRN